MKKGTSSVKLRAPKADKLETAKTVDGNDFGKWTTEEDGATSLEARFAEAKRHLSTSRRRLLNQILQEADKTFFLSSREMANRYGVDAATIVRTIQAMGYGKFADFSRDLRNHFVTQITPYTAMRAATQKSRSVSDYVHQSIEKDLENLNSLKASLEVDKIIELAKQIHVTRRIIIVGIDFAASLAMSLAYGLLRLGCDAEAPAGTSGLVQNKISIMSSKDMLVAISFGRCLRETVEATKRARQRGVPTFGITDSDKTPIAHYCDQYLITSTGRSSFIDSYVAPVSAINAILIACAHTQPKRSLKLLEQFDRESASVARWYDDNAESDGDLDGSL
jgi:DNA-binding MurR/RpiR family transcriptional regulator